MDWLKKLAGYAPDIVGAIASGGATLPATALRIVSKELLGYETDNKDLVSQAVNDATPEQMLALKQCNNDFIIKKIELRNEELANQRLDTQDARKTNQGHWMTWLFPLLILVLASALSAALIFVAIPEGSSDVITFIVGQVFGLLAACGAYWVGSSRGSAEKSMGSMK